MPNLCRFSANLLSFYILPVHLRIRLDRNDLAFPHNHYARAVLMRNPVRAPGSPVQSGKNTLRILVVKLGNGDMLFSFVHRVSP